MCLYHTVWFMPTKKLLSDYQHDANCQEQLRIAGWAYPKTCVICGLFGPCQRELPQPDKAPPMVLYVSGLEFDEDEINCKGGDCV